MNKVSTPPENAITGYVGAEGEVALLNAHPGRSAGSGRAVCPKSSSSQPLIPKFPLAHYRQKTIGI